MKFEISLSGVERSLLPEFIVPNSYIPLILILIKYETVVFPFEPYYYKSLDGFSVMLIPS